ncbi:hypothetical protein ILUMI_03331 [Ignelater luminosus]|uniref:Uncharacterized protein n=1 Tax=Ignelater luminosus TaxID=2038154 RepID=A0A8K0DGH7_IGNLU|nr:hypothetical protein ILUMI_03331 [Ignelater luminosus]
MGSVVKFLTILIVCSLLDLTFGGTYCIIDKPNVRDSKNEVLYGVPASGSCSKPGQSVCFNYIIPLRCDDDAFPNNCTNDTTAIRFIPKSCLKLTCMSLPKFVQTYNVPDIAKFLFFNCTSSEMNEARNCSGFQTEAFCNNDSSNESLTTESDDCCVEDSTCEDSDLFECNS